MIIIKEAGETDGKTAVGQIPGGCGTWNPEAGTGTDKKTTGDRE